MLSVISAHSSNSNRQYKYPHTHIYIIDFSIHYGTLTLPKLIRQPAGRRRKQNSNHSRANIHLYICTYMYV